MKMEKVINWFKENWFLWLFLILFYIGLRLFGYDIVIENSKDQNAKDRLLKSTEDVLTY
jgi:hypothetical protein